MGMRKPNGEYSLQFMQYLMFAYNLVFVLAACAILGVGIWVVVDGSYFSTMVGNELYAVATYFMVIGGGLMFFVSFMGCCGSITKNKCMLWTFLVVNILVLVILLLLAILAGVFRTQLTGAIKDTMRDTLVNHYGVDFHHEYNRRVTYAWDRAQERMECCAVSTKGWRVYQDSKWFDQQVWNPEDQKPYVPQSCCVRDRFWRYINLEVCQKWRLGPPGSPDDGGVNRAIYYTGCYDAGVAYIMEHSTIMVAMGVIIAIFLVLGVVGPCMLIRGFKARERENLQSRKSFEMKGLQPGYDDYQQAGDYPYPT